MNKHKALVDIMMPQALTASENHQKEVHQDNIERYPLFGFVLSIK